MSLWSNDFLKWKLDKVDRRVFLLLVWNTWITIWLIYVEMYR